MHLKHYEIVTDQDKLKVDINAETVGFDVPPLSIECLVENAVRHGVVQKEGGGVVSIHIYDNEDEYIAEVVDNGVGFDSNEIQTDGKNHVGLRNTDSRLKYMVHGRLEVISQVGEGCQAIVHIPKR